MTPTGQIISFYSYKGGVGRSMALANTAVLLAQSGKRVWVIDFDLEAPGLHRYFLKSVPDRYQAPAGQTGTIRLFTDLRARLDAEFLADGAYAQDIAAGSERMRAIVTALLGEERFRYTVSVNNPNTRPATRAEVSFTAAGYFDADYPEQVRRFDWQGFYDAYAEVFPVLAQELRGRYDYVLIDSRTGITDTGSVCTVLLPDKLVLCFSSNEQSLYGAVEVGRQAVRQRAQVEPERALELFPLPLRLENAEQELQRRFMADAQGRFEKAFCEVYRMEDCDLTRYFQSVRVRHDSFYAYGEEISAERDAVAVTGSLAEAYRAFVMTMETAGAQDAQGQANSSLKPTMDERLSYVYNAYEPLTPASHENYTDCALARGGSSLVHEFINALSLSSSGNYRCFLVSGQIGCGKSSELLQVCSSLRSAPAGKRYFPVYLNMSRYLDDYDVAVADILLAMAAELADALYHNLGLDMRDPLFQNSFDGLVHLMEGIGLQAEPDLKLSLGAAGANLKLKIQGLKKDPQLRAQVRQAMSGYMTRLIEEINRIFEVARHKIEAYQNADGVPYRDFVIVLDNLEKIRKLSGFNEGLASQRELFVGHYAQLTGLAAHVIYTVPLRLLRSPMDGPLLNGHYGRSFVLPMIKVADRQRREPYPNGVHCLRTLLQRRLKDHTLDEVFAPEALDLLIRYSGGHARQLMTSVQNACTYTQKLPISLSAARRAIAQTVTLYSTSIPQSYWTKLAALDSARNQQIENGDPDYLTMLETATVLEYQDGGSEDDPFSPMEPWYAVHPIVRELTRFKDAQAALLLARTATV